MTKPVSQQKQHDNADEFSTSIKVDKASKGKNQISNNKNCKEDDKKTSQKEINGPKGLEPTRYGDWESKGRCYDF